MKIKKLLSLILVLLFSLPLWSNEFSLLTRLQCDCSGEYAESRIRVDMLNSFDSSLNPDFKISGFGTFWPCEYIGIGAGNSFFKKYPVRGAWLSASDDYLKTGRLLKSGVGILGKIPVSDEVLVFLSFSGSPENWNDSDELDAETIGENPTVNLNAGGEIFLFDSVSFGTVVNKMNSPAMQYGVYGGIKPDEGILEGLIFNAGYIYNFRDSFMAKSKNAIMCSLGYEIKDFGIGIYGDLISGLNSQYLKKSGKVREYENDETPFYTAVRLSYKLLKNLELNLSGNYVSFYDDFDGGFGFKAGGEYKISKQFGTLEGGIEYNKSKTEVYVFWKMKISENK